MGRHHNPAGRARRVRAALLGNLVELVRALGVAATVVAACAVVGFMATRLKEVGQRDFAVALTVLGAVAVLYQLLAWASQSLKTLSDSKRRAL